MSNEIEGRIIKSVTYLSPAGTRLTIAGDRIIEVELEE